MFRRDARILVMIKELYSNTYMTIPYFYRNPQAGQCLNLRSELSGTSGQTKPQCGNTNVVLILKKRAKRNKKFLKIFLPVEK